MTLTHLTGQIITKNGDVPEGDHSRRTSASTAGSRHSSFYVEGKVKIRHPLFQEEMDLEPPQPVWEDFLGESATASSSTLVSNHSKEDFSQMPQRPWLIENEKHKRVGRSPKADGKKAERSANTASSHTMLSGDRNPQANVEDGNRELESGRKSTPRKTGCLTGLCNALRKPRVRRAQKKRLPGDGGPIAMNSVER